MKRIPCFFTLLVIAMVILSGCQGAQAVRGGSVTDVITNVEPRNSGTTIIWVRTDITSAYCTNDPQVINLAKTYKEFQAFVTIEYDSLNLGDPDTNILGTTGCDPEGEGIRTYRLVSLRLADIETTQTPPWKQAR